MSVIQPSDPIYPAHLAIILPTLARTLGDKKSLEILFESLQIAFDEYEKQLLPDPETVAIFERLKKCYKLSSGSLLPRVYPAAFERHWRRILRSVCHIDDGDTSRLTPFAHLPDILFVDTVLDWAYLTGLRDIPQDITRH